MKVPTNIILTTLLLLAVCVGSNRIRAGNAANSQQHRQLDTPSNNDTDYWFDQKLDHFDPSNNKTWRQRYLINAENYTAGGPAFLYIAGEWEMRTNEIHKMIFNDFNANVSAVIFGLEHRFYGQSRPTPNMEEDQLEYLDMDQALADAAYFRTEIGRIWNLTDVKWVAFGCSYAANLAAWIRMKYPDLFYGSLASSGPVKTVVNYKEYFSATANALKNFASNGDKCVDTIAKASQFVDNIIDPQARWKFLQEKFNTCQPFTRQADETVFYQELLAPFMGLAKTGKFRTEKQNHTVETACQALINKTNGETPIERYVTFLDAAAFGHCRNNSYANYFNTLNNSSWPETGSHLISRSWMWQKCTEFGLFKTTESPNLPFGHHLDLKYYLKNCKKAFPKTFNLEKLFSRVKERREAFEGLEDEKKAQKMSRVIFVNSNMDPYGVKGVLSATSQSPYKAFVLNGEGHCAEFHHARPKDSVQVRQTRDEIINIIIDWIHQ